MAPFPSSSSCAASVLLLTPYLASCCCSFASPCSDVVPVVQPRLDTLQGAGMVPYPHQLFHKGPHPFPLKRARQLLKTLENDSKVPSQVFPHNICFFWKSTCNSLPLAFAQLDVFSLYKNTHCQLLGLQILLPRTSSNTGHLPSLRQHRSEFLVPVFHSGFVLCSHLKTSLLL